MLLKCSALPAWMVLRVASFLIILHLYITRIIINTQYVSVTSFLSGNTGIEHTTNNGCLLTQTWREQSSAVFLHAVTGPHQHRTAGLSTTHWLGSNVFTGKDNNEDIFIYRQSAHLYTHLQRMLLKSKRFSTDSDRKVHVSVVSQLWYRSGRLVPSRLASEKEDKSLCHPQAKKYRITVCARWVSIGVGNHPLVNLWSRAVLGGLGERESWPRRRELNLHLQPCLS